MEHTMKLQQPLPQADFAGKTDEEITEMLLALDVQIKDLPHPVAKAKAVQLVLE